MGLVTGPIQLAIFGLNFALVVIGLVLIIIGIARPPLKGDFDDFDEILDEVQTVKSLPTIMIIVGVVIFFVAFSGCWGALSSNTTLLSLYVGSLSLILLLEIIGGLYFYFNQEGFKDGIRVVMRRFLDDRENNPLQDLQAKLDCCGVDSYKDWQESSLQSIPASCCGNVASLPCVEFQVQLKDGCLERATDDISGFFTANSLAILVAVAVQVGTIAFAMILHSSLKRQEQEEVNPTEELPQTAGNQVV